MKSKSARTPEEISKENKKKTYSFSLIEKNVETLSSLASKSVLPLSTLMDEAIIHYLQYLEDRKR